MLKVKIVGDSFALLSGGSETGEGGAIALSLPAGDAVASVTVNGRAFPAAGPILRLPVTAFKTGVNRIALRRKDGRTLPAEGMLDGLDTARPLSLWESLRRQKTSATFA